MGRNQTKIALTKEQYEHNRGRVYSAIRVVCQRIAGQQIFVARVNASGDSERSIRSLINKGRFEKDWLSKDINPNRLELLEDHPICDMVDHPNELMVRAVLWNMTVANLLITGRSLWVLAQTDGVEQIIPIPTTWAKPVSKNGKMFFEWEVSPPGSVDEPTIVPGDRMAHFYFPDPSNPFAAISPLQMQARGILADEAISEAQQIMFSNGAFPSHALIAGEVETADGPEQVELQQFQKDTILNNYRQQYGGMRNFGLPMIFDAIITDIKRLSDKPEEMAFLESSGLTKTIIYEGFGVNPISAGQVEGANRASSAVADEHLLTNTINPIIELISQGMTKWLAPLFAGDNERLKIWIAPAETRDAEMLLKKWDLGRQTFAMTRNEVRTKLLGLPEKEGFDDVIVPLNMVPGTINPGDSTPATTRDAKVTRKKQIVEMWLKQHSIHELPFAKAIESFFTEQREATIVALEEMSRDLKSHTDMSCDFKSSTSDAIASNVFNPNMWHEKLIKTVEPFLLRQMFSGAATELSITHTTKQFDSLIDEFNPSLPDELIEAIRQFFDELIIQDYWKEINRTTLDNLSRALEAGITEGDTIAEMSSRVFDAMGDDANRFRAARIARTETTGALNSGHHATRQMLAEEGVVVGSEWLTIGDIDVRGNRFKDEYSHVIMHEVKMKIGKDFDVSGEKAPYPGHHSLSAGNRINCFVPETEIEGVVDAGMRSFYEGQITEIEFSSGRRLTVTPNHPILTEDGFIGAGLLQSGDKVVADNREVNGPIGTTAARNNKNYKPVSIEEIFSTLCLLGFPELRCNHTENFYGDGRFIQGDIEVVRPDWELLLAGESGRFEECCSSIFMLKDSELLFEDSHRSFSHLPVTANSSSYSMVSSNNLTRSLFGTHSGPFDQLLLGLCSESNSRFQHEHGKITPRCAEVSGNLINRISRFVSTLNGLKIKPLHARDAIIHGHGLASRSDSDPVFGKHVDDSVVANSQFLRDLVCRGSRSVGLDDVVSVKHSVYSDYVYDVESPYGVIIANGIYTSNCRCVAVGIVDPNELVSNKPPEDIRERSRRNGKPKRKKRKRLCEVHR